VLPLIWDFIAHDSGLPERCAAGPADARIARGIIAELWARLMQEVLSDRAADPPLLLAAGSEAP